MKISTVRKIESVKVRTFPWKGGWNDNAILPLKSNTSYEGVLTMAKKHKKLISLNEVH